MVELNINELHDGDLVVYSDRDVEFKHNSSKVHTSPRLVPDKRLPLNVELKEFTHCVNKGTPNEVSLFIVKETDDDYSYWDKMPNCTSYGC